MTTARACWLVLASACYHPPSQDACGISCETTCPGELVCGSNHRCHDPTAGECTLTTPDAAFDAVADAPDAPPGYTCVNGRFGLQICYPPMLPAMRALESSINTDVVDQTNCTVMTMQTGGTQVCVIYAETINVATTTVHGGRPLVLFATSAINVNFTLDVSSATSSSQVGPAADDASCSSSNGDPVGNVGAGGGAGGSFYGTGGTGGSGGGTGMHGTSAGAQVATGTPSTLRGGCPGGRGGKDGNSTGGTAGNGGGAVYLWSPIAITVTGAINASGAGGLAGTPNTAEGGGGGGSGGMIVLQTGALTFGSSAVLIADGGGGGGGGLRGGVSTDQGPGADPNPAFPGNGALGGGATGGGAGGAGSQRASPPDGRPGSNASTATVDGGGGGGGAGGYILLPDASLSGNTRISPQPQ